MLRCKPVLFGMILVASTAWSQARHYPLIAHADLPPYPPIARSAHITGAVEIQVVVEKGAVVDAQVKSIGIDSHNGPPLTEKGKEKIGQYLAVPSLRNIKSWQFEPDEGRSTFVVKYVYRIEGEQTALPENPKIEVDLPVVRVTARPFKLTVLYGSGQSLD